MANFAQMKNEFDKARRSQPEEEDESQFCPGEEEDSMPGGSILPDGEEEDGGEGDAGSGSPEPQPVPKKPAAAAPREEPGKPARQAKPPQDEAAEGIRGSLVASDGTEICCSVSGSVTCEGTLYLYGSVSGETRAETCYLYGNAYGPVTCTKLVLHQGAKASGGVNAKVLEVNCPA